jgi:phage minor structural protein
MSYNAKFIIKDDRVPQDYVEGAVVGLYELIHDLSYNGTDGTDGSVQQVVLDPGTYFIELWGAEGGYRPGYDRAGGKGGYAKGKIVLTEQTTFNVYVGGYPADGDAENGGFNGGGAGGSRGGAGGGASDIRIGGMALTDRVMVAAGGGGAYSSGVAGAGGGLEGEPGTYNSDAGGKQTKGGIGDRNGGFGLGGSRYGAYYPGGGAGWYGGAAANFDSAGGGSSYIGAVLEGANMEDVGGEESFPKVPVLDGYTETGVSEGHGAVRISVLVESLVTDSNGEVEFAGLEPKDILYYISCEGYASTVGVTAIVDSSIVVEVMINAAKSVATGVAFQVDKAGYEGRMPCVTNIGTQIDQAYEALKKAYLSSFGFQVEISEPIIIDFEGYGIESREQVPGSDFIIVGTTANGISVFPASIHLTRDSLAVLQATVRPPDAADRDVIWSTSDYAVVSVVGDGERGTIRGHVEGIATITAISKDGGYTATCQVTVAERMPVPYEAIKILRPNFSEIAILDNTEIVDLIITKELSGHYGVEFTLPVGVTGWEEIRRGRYIETEGQKFAIEQIRPVRQSDGIPLLQVTCSHIFFEIERVNMPHDTTARSTIQDHVNYVLRNTGFVTLATDKENHFYQIDRVIDYSASDSRFTAFQRIFQVFGGHYRLNDFTVEIIPPRPTPPTSAVVLEYAVTNAAIEKHEDDADVITTLYATGGQVDGVPLERVVQAGPEIRTLYRKERVRFVNFGDIRVWNNFVYVTDQYLEKRQLPRTTYSLSVAELKRINGIEELYPGRDFELDIGKVVQVKDTELGIDTQKLLQRYTYKPLQPEHLSSVIVGDKPFDIAFTETSREGVVQEEEGEWRYDEGTREWIFFPANPIIEDDTGEDYTLTITEHPSSCGPAGIRYRYHTGEDRPEKSTLTIKEGASASGKVIVILDTEIYSVEIEEGDIPEMVAVKIAGADYPGWEAEQADNVVVFTAKRVGAKRYSADYRFGLTGAIGGFVTVKGAQEAFTSDWKDAGLPFEQTFNEGDEVQVIARSDSKWYSLVNWTGDGEGFSPRLYIMDSNQSSQVRFASTAGAIDVRTRTPSNVTEDSAFLQGEILDPSKFGSVERGFVWAYTSNPTLSSNEGQIWAGTGGKGSFSAAFDQPVGDPYDQRYYYRAYAKAYDQECQREVVAYGITRSFTFAYEEYAVEVVVMTIDDIELDAPVNIQPGEGVFSYASGANVTLEIESASLPEGATFERWLIVDQQTGTIESVTENPYSFEVSSSYRIAAVIARPAMVLWVNQEEGTGVIQIADSPDGPRNTWRLGFAMRFDRTVYVWAVPDDESQQGKWTEDSGGVGEEPRVFALGETFVEYRATVRWSPLHVCEKRCIFISPDDPDPTVGVDGNIWLKYRE